MELDRKVRWETLRNELYGRIVRNALTPEDMIERLNVYKGGLYESPKEYMDGYAVNDGSWVKYYYNGKFRCRNKDEIGQRLLGYVWFLMEAGIDDWDDLWYYSLCFLIDRLEYREGLFGCSLDNKNRIESTIRYARANKPQEVWTAKKDKRGYCLDPKVMRERTKGLKEKKEIIGENTRLQKKSQKKKTDERIRKNYDPNEKSIRKNAERCKVSPSRLHQWLKEFFPKQ